MNYFQFHRNFEMFKSTRIQLPINKFDNDPVLSSKNSTVKNLNSLIGIKQKLLDEQCSRTKNASINLFKHKKLKKIVDFQISFKNKQQLLLNNSAIKIQKVVRGFLTRKKYMNAIFEKKKLLASSKIEEMKNTVENLFLSRKSTINAVVFIQRNFRFSKNRRVLNQWMRAFAELRAKKKAKELIKTSLKNFSCVMKVKNKKLELLKARLAKKIKENHAIRVVSQFWEQAQLSCGKFVENAKNYKKKNSLKEDLKIAVNEVQDTLQSFSNTAGRKILKKKKFRLPAISVSPVSRQKFSKNLQVQVKKTKMLSRISSKSVNLRKPYEKLPNLSRASNC